ncbi:DNA polymerase III subunit beta [bacterium]|nr:DNA polymerase III subunit beta [candidate division CSSED10-310 bacterium]
MDIQLPQNVFVEKVQKLQAAVEKSATRPILQNILIESFKTPEETDQGVSKGKITFMATDLDLAIKDVADGEVYESGSITVPGRRLFEALQELPPAPVRLTVVENKWAELTCGNAHFRMMCLDSERFPGIPDISRVEFISIDGALLGKLIKSTSYATSSDENRPILNGVLFKVTEEAIRMVATDGHRMALAAAPNEGRLKQEFEVILSNKMLNEFTRMAAKSGGAMRMGMDSNLVVVNSGEEYVVAKLIDGEYPNYQMVIPKTMKYCAILDRIKFYGLVHRVRLFSDNKTHSVRLQFGENLMEVNASSAEAGLAKDHMEIEYDGMATAIGFNADYLLQALKVIETDAVELHMVQEDEPVLVTPHYTSDKDAKLQVTSLVMPIVV